MFPTPTSSTIPQLMAERLILRAQLSQSRAENARLREERGYMRTSNEANPVKPAFDYRLVLDNLGFGWPDDIIAEAKAMRDAENREAVRQ